MDYYDLGSYTRKVTTAVPEAQLWFDRGLNWLFGFNHAEAIACFQKALERDPGCAMAYWGISYAAGPNYNLPWHLYDPAGKAAALAAAYDAMQGALARADGASPVEQALIRALPARYPQRETIEDQAPWDAAYADAMRQVFQRQPRRPRGAPRLRRGDHEPDALEDVGPQDRRRRRGRRHRGGGRGAGGRLPRHPRLVGPPGAPASLRPPDGDVALPAARAAGGRPAARSGAGCRAPDPHADPHRRALRPLPRRAGLQPEGDRRRPQVPGPRGRDERLRALPHPRLPLRGLRGDVPRPVRGGHGGGAGADRHHARGAPAHPLAADGRFRRGLPVDEAARAGALRQVARDHRPGAARATGSSTARRPR